MGLFRRSRDNDVQETRDESSATPVTPIVPKLGSAPKRVSVDEATGLSAVYRSIDIITTNVSQLSLGVWRGDVEVKPNIRNYFDVSRPQADISLRQFLKQVTTSLSATGNCYLRKYMDDEGRTYNLEVLNPHAMDIHEDHKGVITYKYHGYTKPIQFRADQVQHLRLMHLFGSHYGVGPIQKCQIELYGSLRRTESADQWFDKGGVPTGVVTTSLPRLTPEERQAAKEDWDASMKERGVAFLGQGSQYESIVLNPADAQFIENQEFGIKQVATMFGIPANKLLAEVGGSALTYQNVQDAQTLYVMDTLMSYLGEIEDALNELTPSGLTVAFKVDELLRANDKARAEVYKLYVEMGVLEPDEIRQKEGYGPRPVTETDNGRTSDRDSD